MSFERRMRALPLSQVRITDQFWTRWTQVLVEKTLPQQLEEIEKTDRLKNFQICAGTAEGEHKGLYFNDSDVYKWLEACAYGLTHLKSASLEAKVDEVVETIVAAQEESGYLNTFFQLKHPQLKFRNLAAMHELYCGGHLVEAAVAMFEGRGDRKLLDVAIRFVDCVMREFGEGKKRGYCGHEELELALIKLSQVTGETKYREFARFMVEERGVRPTVFERELKDSEAMAISPYMARMLEKDGDYSGEYAQDHAPIREHSSVVGHAVRAMYLYTAVAELADGLKDEKLENALVRAWESLTLKRMYVTGGIGPSAHNEGFTADYDLPNESAYAETCAACGMIFWGQSLLEMTGSGEYADVIERALYNGALSGISLDGTKYFYVNPLESSGRHGRQPWFECACCPPNIARLIGSLGRYVIGVGESDVYIHQFAGFEASFQIDGADVTLTTETKFPWDGKYAIRIKSSQPVSFSLRVRLPGWCEDISTDFPGGEEAEYEDGYAIFSKVWESGDVVQVELDMAPAWIEANPKVRQNLGRVAMTRGPLVYCAESNDNGFAPQYFSADLEGEIGESWSTELEGVTKLEVEGYKVAEEGFDGLYAPFGTQEEVESKLVMVPYFAWANRGASEMQVWLRT